MLQTYENVYRHVGSRFLTSPEEVHTTEEMVAFQKSRSYTFGFQNP